MGSLTCADGSDISRIGFGTFGSDKYSPAEVAAAALEAAEIGYLHFDCASIYGNEASIGNALMSLRVKRESFWITSKVWNNMHDRVEESCEQSLRDLRLEYLDLYLVHWPFPNHHERGVDVDARDPHAVPFSLGKYMQTWSQMERLVERGLVRHIGTSNMSVGKLRGVIDSAAIKPVVNEMELHPHFQQPELFDFCVSEGVLPIGYCPLGSPSRPERDRTSEDTTDLDDPILVTIAERMGVTTAVVCLLWQKKRGSIPIPFSVKRQQFEPTLYAFGSMDLTDSDMKMIDTIDKKCRLIKGQVFLWPGASGWEELWEDA